MCMFFLRDFSISFIQISLLIFSSSTSVGSFSFTPYHPSSFFFRVACLLVNFNFSIFIFKKRVSEKIESSL